MSASESTWESAIADAAAPPPQGESQETPSEPVEAQPTPAEESAEALSTSVVEPSDTPAAPAVETPEADKATEGQTEPKEEANADDAPEVAQLPPSARKWARTRDKEARLVDDYLEPGKPIREVAGRLYERSPSRYAEMAFDIFDAHKDDFLKKEFGLSVEEVKARLAAEPLPRGESQDFSGDYDALEDETLPDSVKARIREADALKEKYGTLETKVNSIEQQEQQRAQEARAVEVTKIEDDLYQSVISVIPEGIKEYGLEVSEKDPPIVKGLKLAAQHILSTELQPAFAADADNVKAVDRAREFAGRLERQNAFREEDALKVRARNALSKVKEREEVTAIFDALKLWTDSQAAKIGARGSTTPQVPAANGGGTMPLNAPAATWDQLTG